jgi:hypothetical protein
MDRILTTFSPTNIENQQRALDSWLKLGYKTISFNSIEDIARIKQYFDVEFIETDKLGREFGKDYVKLNVFTDWIKENESSLVVNSDIEILEKVELSENNCEIQIFSRNDYKESHDKHKRFDSGYDAFYLTKQFCSEFPKSELVVGQCHWDYLIPMIAIRLNYTLKSPNNSSLFHKTHELQYDINKWKATAKIFSKELRLTGNAHTDSSMAFKQIKRQIKYY